MPSTRGALTARYVHSTAVCNPEQVGKGTRVWQFVVVCHGAMIGDDCNICAHVFIEGDVIVGDRVTVKSGVQLWDGLRVEDDVFIGPNVSFGNDAWPRSRDHVPAIVTTLRRGCSIGAGAVILPGVTVGEDAMVGAGAVVTHDVLAGAIVIGNPARETGEQVTMDGVVAARRTDPPTGVFGPTGDEIETAVTKRKAKLLRLTTAADDRGALTAVEFNALPFTVRRIFAIRDVPDSEVRGQHAHRRCEQLLVCLAGRVRVRADNGRDHTLEAELGSPDRGIGVHVPPLCWVTLDRFDGDTVLLVLASHPYDPDDYIRDLGEFTRLCATS